MRLIVEAKSSSPLLSPLYSKLGTVIAYTTAKTKRKHAKTFHFETRKWCDRLKF